MVKFLAGAGGVFVPASLAACPVCFGQSDSPMAAGINAGILFLLGLTVVVLSLFSSLILYIRRNAAKHHERMEQLRAVVQAGERER